MNILVTAASKHGSTAEIAEEIRQVLEGRGLHATSAAPHDVTSVADFDAIVLGSAVYAGRWIKPALEFVARHGDALARRPLWLFSSGPIGDPPKPEEEPVDVSEIMAVTSARDHRVFAGKLQKASLGFGERAIVTALRAPYGDFRDWDEIRSWAITIADALVGDRSEPTPVGEQRLVHELPPTSRLR